MSNFLKNTIHDNYFINKQGSKKCLFIHIPKTAGISVKKALFNVEGTYHYSFHNYECIFTEKFIKKAFKFTFVRNPISRVYSAYSYLSQGGGNPIDKAFFDTYMADFSNFEDFINHGLSKDKTIQKYIHFRSQKSFLLNGKNELAIDYIGKVETLEKDFNYLKMKLKINSDLPLLNSTKKTSAGKPIQLSNQTLMNLFNLYEDDYQLFNYSWNNNMK